MMPDDESSQNSNQNRSCDADFPTLQMIEAECQSLGHELHDAVIPLLFGAASAVASVIDDLPAEQDRCRQKLTDAHRWLSDAMQISRQMLGRIHPPELQDQSWLTAVHTALDQLATEHSIPIQWHIDVDDTEVLEVPATIGLSCYRIIVEATRNAVSHGQADQISIVVRQQDSGFLVQVSDNGVGFDPDQIPADRFGIRTMTGRARLIGASLLVDSHSGGPTSVTLNVPNSVGRAT